MNKETLQEYNTRLAENNTSLDDILTTINNLPEGGSSGGSSEVYFLEETRIGTWFDGKPLYRRCFKGITEKSTSTIITNELNSDNCSVKNVGGYITEGIENPPFHMNIGGYINSNWYCGFYTAQANLVLYHPTKVGGYDYELFIEYTKTTD